MILLIIAILIHIYITFTTHTRVKNNGTIYRRPLYDLIHTNTPNLNKFDLLDLNQTISDNILKIMSNSNNENTPSNSHNNSRQEQNPNCVQS